MSIHSFDSSFLDSSTNEIFTQTVGKSNIDEVYATQYKITNMIPGQSYNLRTSVYNRGDSLIYEKDITYWPTSNISMITTYDVADFEDNITFVVGDLNKVTVNTSNLDYNANVEYNLYFENILLNVFIYVGNIGPYRSETVTEFEINTITNMYTKFENIKFDIYYSVIIEGDVVISHNSISSDFI